MAVKRRIVVVGVGSIGLRHVRLLCEKDDLVVEVCEPRPEALERAGFGNLVRYDSLDQVLQTRPYAVVIATPVEFHADQAVTALEAGVHVLCEKPMASTLAGAKRMLEAANSAPGVLSFGFNLHFHPGLRRLQDLIGAGALGQVLQVQYRTGSYITLVNSRSRYQAALEGALLMDYAHQPDAVHWLVGERPVGVYMVARQAGSLEFSSNPNYLTMVCDYESPLLSTIELNYVQMPQRHEIEVIGDEGWAAYDFESGAFQLASRAEQALVQECVPVERDDLYRKEHRTFLEAAEGCGPASSPPSEAIVSMEVIEAAMASWKSGARVELGGAGLHP